MCKFAGVFLSLMVVSAAIALPAEDHLMLDLGGDTAVVESTIREARAAPDHIEELLNTGVTDAFLHTYGDDEKAEDDVLGYHKTSQDKGNDGYKHFDSYHKKDGDKYGFETHSEFGKADKASAGGSGKNQKQYADYDIESDAEENDDDEAETKNIHQVVEDIDGGKKGLRAFDAYEDASDYDDSGHYTGHETEHEEPAEETGTEGESNSYEENYTEIDPDASEYADDAESYDDDF